MSLQIKQLAVCRLIGLISYSSLVWNATRIRSFSRFIWNRGQCKKRFPKYFLESSTFFLFDGLLMWQQWQQYNNVNDMFLKLPFPH